MVEDPRGNNEDTWSRDALANETSIAPTIGESTSNNPWTRDVGKGDSVVNTKGVAVMEVAMAQGHQASYAKEIAPSCTTCGKPMLLRQLHPGGEPTPRPATADEEHFGGDDMDNLRAQTAELIELKVDAILVGRTAPVLSVLTEQLADDGCCPLQDCYHRRIFNGCAF